VVNRRVPAKSIAEPIAEAKAKARQAARMIKDARIEPEQGQRPWGYMCQ
jgi:hypothetical protein